MTLGFLALVAAAASMTAFPSSHLGHRSLRFSHNYPPDPVRVERPKASGPMPTVGQGNTVTTKRPIDSFGELSAHVTPGTLVRQGRSRWLLRRPIAVAHRGVIEISGGTLEIARHAFLESRARGTLVLRWLTVIGVGQDGRPLATPAQGRGFIVGRDSGVLRLEHDSIRDLGYLGVVAYGISFRRPGPGSGISASSITGNYFGVFISHADGVRIADNRFAASDVYGIDPYGGSTNIAILRNIVLQSGLHGIVLANGIRFSHVEGNVVDGARDHGLVLVNGSDGNTVRGNTVRRTFDGIVLTGSSRNVLVGNTVEAVKRFGIRLSHGAAANQIEANLIGRSIVGIYLYSGARENVLRDNRFSANYENVRVRRDAPGNVVTPRPARSELGG
jgi:parallel beta-helix repeat protein